MFHSGKMAAARPPRVAAWVCSAFVLAHSLFLAEAAWATITVPRFESQWSVANTDQTLYLAFDPKKGLQVKEVLKKLDERRFGKWKFDAVEIQADFLKYLKPEEKEAPMEVIAMFWHSDHRMDFDAGHSLFFRHDREKSSFVTTGKWDDIPEGTTIDQCLPDIRRSIRLQEEFLTIFKKASLDQIERILAFILENEDPVTTNLGNHYFVQTAADFIGDQGGTAAEKIRERLSVSTTPRERALLIELIGSLPASKLSFDALIPYLDRSHPTDVRRMAILFLTRMDSFQATGEFARFLVEDDPDLASFLFLLCGEWNHSGPEVKNPAVLKPLADLAESMKRRRDSTTTDHLNRTVERYWSALYSYDHPRHLPILMDLALDKTNPNAVVAQRHIQELSGVEIKMDNLSPMMNWRKQNRPAFESPYDLQTPTGIASWLEAADRSGKRAQTILMKLWDFEPHINEGILIEKARNNEIARKLLADLWDKDRLSVDARRTLVKDHLSFRLVRVPNPPDEKRENLFTVEIAAVTDFPFPAGANIGYRQAIALDREPKLERYSEGFSLCGIAKRDGLGTLTGTSADGSKLNAIVQIRELETSLRDGANDYVLLWELEWKVEPLDLRSEPK
jgi:hypothetical protein